MKIRKLDAGTVPGQANDFASRNCQYSIRRSQLIANLDGYFAFICNHDLQIRWLVINNYIIPCLCNTFKHTH
jgi:hypothetical protein